MGWEDRDYMRGDDGGGWRAALRRMFIEGDNLQAWSVPLFRAFGIRVRLHLLFIVIAAAYLLWSLVRPDAAVGPGLVLSAVIPLFALVLIHEFGHCFACRRVGGEADEILLWPLGGLAVCLPPQTWRAHLITVIGGPAVHLVIAPVTGLIMLVTGADVWLVLGQGLWDRSGAIAGSSWFAGAPDGSAWLNSVLFWAKITLFWTHTINIALFLFNMLLPMYPMDAGRVLHALLWRKRDYETATMLTTGIAIGLAILVAVVAILGQQTMLAMIALFGAFSSYQERQRVRFLGDDALAMESWQRAEAEAERESAPAKPSRSELKAQEQAVRDQEELDRALAKISESGIESLTRSERKILKRATDRQRGDPAE